MKKVSILGIIALSALTLSACSSNKDDSKPTKPKTEHKEDKKSKTKKVAKKNNTAKNDNSKTSASTSNSNKVTTDNSNQTSNKNSAKQASNNNGYVPNTATKENTPNMSNYDRMLADKYHYDVLTGKYYGTPQEQAQGKALAEQDQTKWDDEQNQSYVTNANDSKAMAEKDAAYAQMDKDDQDNSQATTNDDSSDN